MSERWAIAVGTEVTEALLDRAAAPLAATLVLGHGAGSHMEHRTMSALAAELSRAGLDVVRFNFLYRQKQGAPPDRMPRLCDCFRAVAERARRELVPRRILIGGHSMGGRAASHLAADGFSCDGVVLLAYPLHPAGEPEKLRDAHLPRIGQPVLCLNGTRDQLCDPQVMAGVLEQLPASWTMHWLEGADHGYHVLRRSGRTDEEVQREIGEVTREWIATALAGS